ncbi:hypothetical protein Mapa_007778 [Marchantia paleacea]|nr:hypothetical protein Mapa_007778 [Marchantia paleacea]
MISETLVTQFDHGSTFPSMSFSSTFYSPINHWYIVAVSQAQARDTQSFVRGLRRVPIHGRFGTPSICTPGLRADCGLVARKRGGNRPGQFIF